MKNEASSNVVHVRVTVDATGEPVCTPPTADVKLPNSLLVFKLDAPGYHFVETDAIVVQDAPPDFPYPSWTQDKTTVSLLDLCNNIDIFDYTVTLRDKDGRKHSVDPKINNSNTSSGSGGGDC